MKVLRLILVAAIAIAAMGLGVWVALDNQPAPEALEPSDEESDFDDDDPLYGEELPDDRGGPSRWLDEAPGMQARPSGFMRGEQGERGEWRGRTEEARQERRRRRRERWENMTPEERAERHARRRARFVEGVSVEAREGGAASLTPDQVFDGMQMARSGTRDCFEQSGIERQQVRDAMRGAARPTITFAVTPDGKVEDGSITIDPPPPEALAGCFMQGLEGAHFDNEGETAEVEVQLPERRRGRRDAPDAG